MGSNPHRTETDYCWSALFLTQQFASFQTSSPHLRSPLTLNAVIQLTRPLHIHTSNSIAFRIAQYVGRSASPSRSERWTPSWA